MTPIENLISNIKAKTTFDNSVSDEIIRKIATAICEGNGMINADYAAVEKIFRKDDPYPGAKNVCESYTIPKGARLPQQALVDANFVRFPHDTLYVIDNGSAMSLSDIEAITDSGKSKGLIPHVHLIDEPLINDGFVHVYIWW